MKTNGKKVLIFSVITVVTVVMSYQPSSKSKLEDLLLENVEALANGEVGPMVRCIGSGTLDCPINHVKVRMIGQGYALE